MVSDCDALNDGAFDAYIEKYFNGSKLQQARVGVQAGTDVDCGALYGEQVKNATQTIRTKEDDPSIFVICAGGRGCERGYLARG